MAQKIHSSGFDDSIKNNFEAEEQFIRECAENFDIIIDRNKMVNLIQKKILKKI